MIRGRYETALAVISIDQPQRVGHSKENSSLPGGEECPLQSAVDELGLVVDRINNGNVAFHGYQDQVKIACEWSHFHQRRESSDNHVEAAWIVEDVNNEDKTDVPEGENCGHDVGNKHAGQDEVFLGPESVRLPDGDERKAVAAQVDYGHSEENGSSHEYCC